MNSVMVNTEMSEFWNGEGGRKWVRFQSRFDTSLIPFGQGAMAEAAIVNGENALDIGCGCGDTSFEIARRVGPFGHVLGIDISELILERARSRTASAGEHNIRFECADAQLHRFESMSFDVAFSRFGVMFFDNPVVAFSNIRKALSPFGRMAFICWQPIKVNQWVNLPLEVAGNHLPLPPKSDPEEPGAFSFGDPDRVERILDSAGFRDILIEKFETSFNVGANLDKAVKFLTHIGPASFAFEDPGVDEMARSRIADELRDTLTPYMTVNGIELDAATWIVTASNW